MPAPGPAPASTTAHQVAPGASVFLPGSVHPFTEGSTVPLTADQAAAFAAALAAPPAHP